MTTELDDAHAAMMRDEEDEDLRRAFFATLARTELFVALREPPDGEKLKPLLLETPEGTFALAFDHEARLGDFMPGGTEYAALAGRQLARMLAAANAGLGVNLEVAPSAILLAADAMAWISEMGTSLPDLHAGQVGGLGKPDAAPDGLEAVLSARLAHLGDVTSAAWLAEGESGLVLLLADVVPPAQPACSAAVAEALNMGGFANLVLDVGFISGSGPEAQNLDDLGTRLALPQGRKTGANSADGEAMPVADKPPRLI